DQRCGVQEMARLLLGAEAHHALDAGTVVPGAVEDHDLAGRRKMRHVALQVHLRLLAVGRRRQRDDAEHPRTDALGDGLDRAALAGAIAPLEHDAALEALVLDPLLELDELGVELAQLPAIFLVRELLARRCVALVPLGHRTSSVNVAQSMMWWPPS